MMEKEPDMQNIQLIFTIVNVGYGSKILKVARQSGISGGTILLGKGTTKPHLLGLLDLGEIKKEIVLLIADNECANKALIELNRKFEFKKPNHGIAFTTSLSGLVGVSSCKVKQIEARGGNPVMYQAILVIVEKGLAEKVMDAATKAGAKGGTIINARGAGLHEHQTLFSMAIEPEKEVVMILSDTGTASGIVESVRNDLKIDEPGNGILFTLNVDQTYGLYE